VDGATTAKRHHAPVARAQPVAQRVAAATPAAAGAPLHATVVQPRRPAKPRARRVKREFRSRHAAPAATEFASVTTGTAAAPPSAPTPTVVQSTSPEPAGSGREFASEFGG